MPQFYILPTVSCNALRHAYAGSSRSSWNLSKFTASHSYTAPTSPALESAWHCRFSDYLVSWHKGQCLYTLRPYG